MPSPSHHCHHQQHVNRNRSIASSPDCINSQTAERKASDTLHGGALAWPLHSHRQQRMATCVYERCLCLCVCACVVDPQACGNTVHSESLASHRKPSAGECGLTRSSGVATGKGGKPIIKIRKLNLRLLLRREDAVQRTPPKAHSPGADYGIYNVLNWNASSWVSSALQCTPY